MAKLQLPEGIVLPIDTTMNWPYPPLSLSPKEYMDEAINIW